jgi:transposase InsO family protein
MTVNTYRYRSVLPNMGKKNYHLLMKTISNSQKIEVNKDVVKFRLHCLNHFRHHGLTSFLSAFPQISRTTIYRWQAMYLQSKRNPASLIPKSTRPKRLRQMRVDYRLVGFIRSIRESENYGFMGKDKIKPLLDAYAKEIGITSVSTGVIGKIIKRKKLTKNTHALKCKKWKRGKAGGIIRIKHSPKVKAPGYIEVDCVTINLNGRNYYFVCLIDVFTRFALASYLPSLKAKLVTEILKWFINQYYQQTEIKVHTIQTDNGSEFLADFHDYCLTHNLQHIFTYPHHPQTNGYIERYNCSVQKEFLERSDELYTGNIDAFLPKLDRYNTWYNEVRPHSALKNRTPIIFIKNYLSQMCVT